MAGEGFVGRWSRLKRASDDSGQAARRQGSPVGQGRPDLGSDTGPWPIETAATGADSDTAGVAPVGPATGGALPAPALPGGVLPESLAGPQPAASGRSGSRVNPLPAIDSLGNDSDYSMFMRSGVDPGVRLSALKKLFTDPHFNVMDGLDIYIDDYSKPDPMPLAWLRRLDQSRILGLSGEEPVAHEPQQVARGGGSAGPAADVEPFAESERAGATPPDTASAEFQGAGTAPTVPRAPGANSAAAPAAAAPDSPIQPGVSA